MPLPPGAPQLTVLQTSDEVDSVIWLMPMYRRALLLDPAALLARLGVPGRFAPGQWHVVTSDEGIELSFRE